MRQSVIYEVSDILDTFNIEEISKLLQQQVDSNDEFKADLHTTDHFKPIYYKYRSIVDTDENSDDVKAMAKDKFMYICQIFLSMICKKYNIEIDDVWKDDHYEDLPGFVMALYSFFILDLGSNIYEVCVNYIKENKSFIFQTFEERKSKKDASTLVNKKIMNPEMLVITSNIYDITTWILSQLSEEQYIEYMDDSYVPLGVIKGMFEEGLMGGNFMNEINDQYSNNIGLKGEVCFKITQLLKKNKL